MRHATPSVLSREPVRVYVYGVTTALVLALVALGVLDDEGARIVDGILVALLAVPGAELARRRVSPAGPALEQRPDLEGP